MGSMSLRSTGSSRGLWFVMLLAVLAWVVRYHPPGQDLMVFDDDARQHVYWTARFQDPELFKEDLLTEFISSPIMDPPGYQLLYSLGTLFLDPLPFSQVLSLVLLLFSIWFLELWSRSMIAQPSGRFLLQMLFLFFSLYGSSGGFPRGFAFPLFIGFMASLKRGRAAWGALVMVLEALFYPPILLNTMAMAGIWVIGELKKRQGLRVWLSKSLFLAAGLGICLGILLLIYVWSDARVFGPQVSSQEAREMPEFWEGGRSPFFQESILGFLLFGRSGMGAEYVIGFALILGVMVLLGGVRIIRVPCEALNLLWTSLVIFAVAHMVLFRLHLPSRYTMYTLPLALMLIIGASTEPFLEATRGIWIRFRSTRLPAWLGSKWFWRGTLAVILLLYVWAQAELIVKVDTQVVALDRTQREMLEFLGSLPKDVLVAAYPLDADNIPLVSLRRVLANKELSLPYQLGYYKQVRERILDFFQAYYATQWEEIEQFVRKYGIAALVVNKTHFTPSFFQGRIYFEPFQSFAKQKVGKAEKEGFALLAPPTDKVCFQNSGFLVLCW